MKLDGRTSALLGLALLGNLSCSGGDGMTPSNNSTVNGFDRSAMLKSIETGDPAPVAIAVNEAKYVQHNPQTHEGSEGLAVLFARLAKTNPHVNMVRGFEDGDFVFAHMEYDFSTRRIGFEMFRFAEGQAVEHWDNIQLRQGPNASGRSMVDGASEVDAAELGNTESNRALVRTFVETVLVGGKTEQLEQFVDKANFAEHNARLSDDLDGLRAALEAREADSGRRTVDYERVHRVLAQGNFVLSQSEGHYAGAHSAFFDLFRVQGGKIVEHWDTLEKVAPLDTWKNSNGKF